MNSGQRALRVQKALATSVADLKVDLERGHLDDPLLLCDLLIETHTADSIAREHAVRARICKLIRRSAGA